MSESTMERAPVRKDAPAPLPRAFWYLFAGMLVNRLGAFVILYIALYLTRQRGFSVGLAGVAVAGYGLGSIMSTLGGGVLTDAWGRRRTMMLSLVLGAVFTALLGLVSGRVALMAITVALGLASDAFKPAAKAAVADLVGEADRVRAFGLLYWAANIGVSASAIVGGVIASRSFTALFLVDAVTSVLCAVVIGYGTRSLPQAVGQTGGTGNRGRGIGLREAMADRVFIGFVLLCLAFWWVYFQLSVALPVTLAHAGVDPVRYGMIIAVNGVTVVLLQPPINRAVRRVPLAQAVAGAAALLGVGFGMFAWIHGLPLFVLAVVVWTLGEIVFSIAAPALVASLAPPSMQGRYQGVFGVSVSIALFAGPALGGALLAGVGPAAFWTTCLVVGLVVAMGHHLLAPAYARSARERGSTALITGRAR